MPGVQKLPCSVDMKSLREPEALMWFPHSYLVFVFYDLIPLLLLSCLFFKTCQLGFDASFNLTTQFKQCVLINIDLLLLRAVQISPHHPKAATHRPLLSWVRRRSQGHGVGCPTCPSNMKAPKSAGAGVLNGRGETVSQRKE